MWVLQPCIRIGIRYIVGIRIVIRYRYGYRYRLSTVANSNNSSLCKVQMFLRTVARRRGLASAAASAWRAVEPAPADPILGLVAAFKEDGAAAKVNVAQGAYRTDEGEPFVLDSVKEASTRVAAALASGSSNKEYLPIEGHADFRRLSAELVFGSDSPILLDGRCATLQTISGTGAVSVAANALRLIGGFREIYVPDPSWGNHQHIFASAGLGVRKYRYLDARTGTTLDFEGLAADLEAVPAGAAVLLHACAHNPTGIDPTPAQWATLAGLFARRGLVAVFDSAYQGYASGDLDADAAAVRAFEAAGVLPVVCQSYAKSMGLYGERIGAVNFACSTPAEAEAVLSQVKQKVIRPVYSSPPLHGALLAAAVLGDVSLREQWRGELRLMAGRVQRMRQLLADELRRVGAPSPDGGDWAHVTDQIGMFAYTGLKPEQVDALRADWHVYLTRDGRMSMAGMKPDDVPIVAKAIHAVCTAAAAPGRS